MEWKGIGILRYFLSENYENRKIGVFAILTFNTDYIFVKEENFSKAVELMCSKGHSIV